MKLSARTTFVAVCIAAMIFGYAVLGSLLDRSAIGLDFSAFPAGGLLGRILGAFGVELGATAGIVWLVIGALAVLIGSTLLLRGRLRAHADATTSGRRSFLLASGGAFVATLVAIGAGLARALAGVGNDGRGWRAVQLGIGTEDVVKTDPDPKPGWKGSRVRAWRRLGRTGFEVSDVVLGSGPIRGEKGERIVREAVARGVNYVDTAPDYSASGSEEAVGRALQGVRDDVFLATKFCTPHGHLPPGTPVATYVAAVEDSLRRLQTDRVDLIHIHSCDEIDRLMDENVHAAFDLLKQQGKARFLGFSSHTPNLAAVTERAIESGRFDVMMPAYHHGIWPELQDLIGRARREQDMGVVAMKTLKGARHHGLEGFREHADAYSQAALTWTLSNPDISCAVISFFEHQHVDEYLHASGRQVDVRDLAILEEYDRQVRGVHCAPHCNACHTSCPEGLPIADVLRHRMYFEDYGWEKEAMRLYAGLEKDASQCAACPAPCLGACPIDVPVADRMRGAHEVLRLDV